MLDISHIEAPVLRDLVLPKYPSVVVAGAYKGDTVEFILKHHREARVLAVEPQSWAARLLKERIGDDARVSIDARALGAVETEEIGYLYKYDTDACSLLELDSSVKPNKCVLAPAVDVLKFHGFGMIDLFVMNLEGYEYKLIPWLLGSWHIQINKFLVQFHFLDTMYDEYETTASYLRGNSYMMLDIGKGWELWETD